MLQFLILDFYFRIIENIFSCTQGIYKWVLNNNGDDSFTGPSTDHTLLTTSGSYINVQRNNGTASSNARFISPFVRDSFTTCELNFWYQVKGLLEFN
jgi:hypothetical protein